jgi:hypothetical protein
MGNRKATVILIFKGNTGSLNDGLANFPQDLS